MPVVQSNINRFSNGFHSRIAISKLYNIAAQSLSRKQTSLHQNNYRTFLRDIRFPCVSSDVFKAITISISRHVLSCWMNNLIPADILGQKLTILENCIFRSARIRITEETFFLKIAITNPIFVRFRNGFHLLVTLCHSRQRNVEISEFQKFIAEFSADYWFLTIPPKSPSIVLKIKNLYFWGAKFCASLTCEYDVILTIFVFFSFFHFWVKFSFFAKNQKRKGLSTRTFRVDSRL